MTRLLRALQLPAAPDVGADPPPVANPPPAANDVRVRIRIDSAYHRAQRWLAPVEPAAADESREAAIAAEIVPDATNVTTVSSSGESPPADGEALATRQTAAVAEQLAAEVELLTIADPDEQAAPEAALDRLAAWLAFERSRQPARPQAAPRPHLPLAFQGWIDEQLRRPATRAQLERLGGRIGQRISAWDRTITLCGLSNEADVALTGVALAAILGERGYRVALVELEADQPLLLPLVGDAATGFRATGAERGTSGPRALPFSNVWLGSTAGLLPVGGKSAQDLFSAAGWPEFDVYLSAWGDAAECAIAGGVPYHPGRLVAVTRIGVTTRTDYRGFVRRAKNHGWQLEGCVVLGDRW